MDFEAEGESHRSARRIFARPSTSLAPRVVILGGGFAGVTTALELAKRCIGTLPVHIILLSQQNFFVFTPLLAEAVTGAVESRHVLYPIRSLCGRWGIEFGEVTIVGIDPDKRRVIGRHSRSHIRQHVHYDLLVVALGATPNVAVAPGGAEHALTFKGIGDAIRIRNRVIDLFEAAALSEDPWEQTRLLTFVVIGAGHAGTELIAGLEELTRGILKQHYPSVPSDRIRLVLVGGTVLPQTTTELARYAKEQLRRRGIESETGRAAQVSGDGLTLQDGRFIPSHCVIWTAGNRVNEIVTGLPFEKTKDGRLLVNEFFEAHGARDLYALGDDAAQMDPDSGAAYVATAQVATRQARALAAVLEARITGRPKVPFRFRPLGEMVPLGRRTAVADLRGVELTGFWAWVLWKCVYIFKLPTVASRTRVLLDWIVETFFERDVSEVSMQEKGKAGHGKQP